MSYAPSTALPTCALGSLAGQNTPDSNFDLSGSWMPVSSEHTLSIEAQLFGLEPSGPSAECIAASLAYVPLPGHLAPPPPKLVRVTSSITTTSTTSSSPKSGRRMTKLCARTPPASLMSEEKVFDANLAKKLKKMHRSRWIQRFKNPRPTTTTTTTTCRDSSNHPYYTDDEEFIPIMIIRAPANETRRTADIAAHLDSARRVSVHEKIVSWHRSMVAGPQQPHWTQQVEADSVLSSSVTQDGSVWDGTTAAGGETNCAFTVNSSALSLVLPPSSVAEDPFSSSTQKPQRRMTSAWWKDMKIWKI